MTSEKNDLPHTDADDYLSVHAKSDEKSVTRHLETVESVFGHHESPEWKAVERKVVRKLDMMLMPIVWILYVLNYLDRNNIA